MIQIKREFIADIPILHVVQNEKSRTALPAVIYYHGFNGEKESSLTLAYKIAEQGIRVILPDAYLHGERQENLSQTELSLAFWEIVMQNIKELDILKTYLTEEKLVEEGRIGIGGTSMGGITTFGALKTYPWLKTAAVLMGTPKMTEYAHLLIDEFNKNHTEQIDGREAEETIQKLKAYDITIQPKALANRPLFIWHGEKDTIVPFQHSQSFYEEVKESYEPNDRLSFLPEKGRGHHVTKQSIAATAKWFSMHL